MVTFMSDHWRQFFARLHEHAQDLAALQQDFPAFSIWQEATGKRTRLVAVRRHRGISPHTVVTADPAELRAVLARHQRIQANPLTIGHPGHQDEYPQAIADDYPGWGVKREDGRWTAWCPAFTVHAVTAAGLRAAIEQAITSDGQA
jgi:hypothetical protein